MRKIVVADSKKKTMIGVVNKGTMIVLPQVALQVVPHGVMEVEVDSAEEVRRATRC